MIIKDFVHVNDQNKSIIINKKMPIISKLNSQSTNIDPHTNNNLNTQHIPNLNVQSTTNSLNMQHVPNQINGDDININFIEPLYRFNGEIYFAILACYFMCYFYIIILPSYLVTKLLQQS